MNVEHQATLITMIDHKCIECGISLLGAHLTKQYCSRKCKSRWWSKRRLTAAVKEHACRMCGNTFTIDSSQHNKWLCSDACRRASNSKSVRTFHLRKPTMEAVYRQRTRDKKLPSGNLTRFYRTNPRAPKACESCGEARVLDVAHRPEHPRLGAWRSSANCKWPEMVWVLCPTCHTLLDRMHYPPSDLGLK